MQVAADDDGVEGGAGERPWRILEVGMQCGDSGNAGHAGECLGVAIDGADLKPLRRQPARVAATAAGKIEDSGAGGECCRPADYPGRWLLAGVGMQRGDAHAAAICTGTRRLPKLPEKRPKRPASLVLQWGQVPSSRSR